MTNSSDTTKLYYCDLKDAASAKNEHRFHKSDLMIYNRVEGSSTVSAPKETIKKYLTLPLCTNSAYDYELQLASILSKTKMRIAEGKVLIEFDGEEKAKLFMEETQRHPIIMIKDGFEYEPRFVKEYYGIYDMMGYQAFNEEVFSDACDPPEIISFKIAGLIDRYADNLDSMPGSSSSDEIDEVKLLSVNDDSRTIYTYNVQTLTDERVAKYAQGNLIVPIHTQSVIYIFISLESIAKANPDCKVVFLTATEKAAKEVFQCKTAQSPSNLSWEIMAPKTDTARIAPSKPELPSRDHKTGKPCFYFVHESIYTNNKERFFGHHKMIIQGNAYALFFSATKYAKANPEMSAVVVIDEESPISIDIISTYKEDNLFSFSLLRI